MQNENTTPKIFITQKALIDGQMQDVYDARLLHEKLGSKRQFVDWIKTRLKDFVENVDYISFSRDCEKPLGGRPVSEYLLTIDTAKLISMQEKSPMGKAVRRAFVDFEKKVQKQYLQNAEGFKITKLQALEMAVESEKKLIELENKVQKQEIEKQEMQVAVNNANKLCENLADGVNLMLFTECSSIFGMTHTQLRGLLYQNGWIYSNRKLFPTTQGVIDGYVKNIHIEFPRWSNTLAQYVMEKDIAFRITKKGYEVLLKQVSKLMGNVQNNTAGVQTVQVLVHKQDKEVGYAEVKQGIGAKNVPAMCQTAMV